MKILLGLALALVSASVGCGSASAGSCALTSGGICEEFSASYNASQVMQACPAAVGTYSADGCTTTNRVGHCVIGTGNAQITQSYYAPVTAATAMQACTAGGGTWTAN